MQAEYIYDGAGNRVQQMDHTGAAPLTITYTNDVAGLTQVLVADDGAEQVYNLFGLDLIGQEEGSQTRTLLADGLGSARLEMVEDDVESVTTYGPYGNLLAQSGNDEPVAGTSYGYTGEQHDASTGLLYLRARYYNPALRSFMGRDPWSGNKKQPKSMNGFSYVNSSPISLVDPTGQIPQECKGPLDSQRAYVNCVGRELGVDLDHTALLKWMYLGTSGDDDFDAAMRKIKPNGGTETCFTGPIPYRGPGYLEGLEIQTSIQGYDQNTWPFNATGEEIVYDFATFERATFTYEGGFLTDSLVIFSISESVGVIHGFRSWSDIESDYRGTFIVGSLGFSPDLPVVGSILSVSAGSAGFAGYPDPSVWGTSDWVAASLGAGDLVPALEPSGSKLSYRLDRKFPPYVNPDSTIQIQLLMNHLIQGDNSPWLLAAPVGLHYAVEVLSVARPDLRIGSNMWEKTATAIQKYATAYEENHRP